jgi:hypothetical protein
MNGKLFLILLGGFCLVALSQANALKDEEKDEPETAGAEDKAEADPDEKEKATGEEEKEPESAPAENEDEGSAADQAPDDAAPFACNLKFKRVGCYADKGKKERPLRSFIMSDADLGQTTKKGKMPQGDKFNGELPKFACKCANEAINDGNAVFGIQNIAECWTGPDDSKYDKDGASEDCVTFDYAKCSDTAEICAGKKHSNFVYYVDSEEHTKSKEEIKKEFAEYTKKVSKWRKEQAEKKAKKAKKGKKAKKAKKAKKE